MNYVVLQWLLLLATIFTMGVTLLDKLVLVKHRGQVATPHWITRCYRSYPWLLFLLIAAWLGFSVNPQMGVVTFNFPLVLTLAVVVSGFIYLLDICVLAKRRQAKGLALPSWVEHAKSFFPVLLLVLVIRSFIAQPFHVPSGSLEPTVLPGDFVLTNQFTYGLRLPVLNTKIISIHEPKRGDIAVFRWPVNPQVDLVKRVVGLPGDHIVYKDKQLIINGKPATLTEIGPAIDYEDGDNLQVIEYQEDLLGVKHNILINPNALGTGDIDITVPPGQYFMMGDNRDNSDDSRTWGPAPESSLVGKAEYILLSFDPQTHKFRWQRSGDPL